MASTYGQRKCCIPNSICKQIRDACDIPCIVGFRESLESDNRFATNAGLGKILLA